jgi:hypothetical protein
MIPVLSSDKQQTKSPSRLDCRDGPALMIAGSRCHPHWKRGAQRNRAHSPLYKARNTMIAFDALPCDNGGVRQELWLSDGRDKSAPTERSFRIVTWV